MVDWHDQRGIATEPNIDRFICSLGGERVDKRLNKPNFENADYIFDEHRILIELKIIETEFGNMAPFARKELALQKSLARKFGIGPILRMERAPDEFYARGMLEIYRGPLSRIAKKANRQIRQTKKALNVDQYKGILLCVNDEFRKLNVSTVVGLFGRILHGANSQIDAFVYLTNHYVHIPGNNYANLLWVPYYADENDDDLQTFVNWLGKEWFDFGESEIGPSANRIEGPDIDIMGARPIR